MGEMEGALPCGLSVCCFSIPIGGNGHDAAFDGEAFATDVERVEGIGTIGAALEAVLVGFSEFFAAFVLFAVVHARALDGNEQVLVVGFVEVGHEARLSGKAAIDEQVFFDVAHGGAEVHGDDRPTAALEFVFDDPFEVLVIDGVVRAAGGGVEIEHNGLLGEVFVVLAEVAHEFGEFSFVFHIEGFHHIEAVCAFVGLPNDHPVNIGIEVEGDAQGCVRLEIAVHAGVHLGESLEVVVEGVEVGEVRGSIFVGGAHGRVKAVAHDFHGDAENGGLENEGREVAFHLSHIVFPQHGHVGERGVGFVEHGLPAQLRELAVEFGDGMFESRRGASGEQQLLLELVALKHEPLDESDELRITIFFVVEKPAAFFCHGHIGGDEHPVMERQVTKFAGLSAVGLEGFVFELFEVDKFCLVDVEEIEALGVGRAFAVLRNDLSDGAGVEGNDIVPAGGRDERLGPVERFGRWMTDAPMYVASVAPGFPVHEHGGQRVGECALAVGSYEGGGAARHELEVAQVGLCVEHTFSRAASGHHDAVACAGADNFLLHLIEVYFFHLFTKPLYNQSFCDVFCLKLFRRLNSPFGCGRIFGARLLDSRGLCRAAHTSGRCVR